MPFIVYGSITNYDPRPPPPPVDVIDYQFKVKGSTATVPTTTLGTSYTITNSGVTMYSDPARGYVFYWIDNTQRYLTLQTSASIPITNGITRTFWLDMSGATTAAYSNNLYSGDNWAIYPSVTNNVGYKITSFPGVTTTTTRGFNTWIFYAITSSTTGTAIYVNGVFDVSTSLANTTNTNEAIQFGLWANGANGGYVGYMDDMRQYSRILSPAEILKIYNITK